MVAITRKHNFFSFLFFCQQFEASLAFDAVFAAAEGYKEPDPPEDLTPRCEPTIRKSREGVEYAKQIKNVGSRFTHNLPERRAY